jgi:hypothetical protein
MRPFLTAIVVPLLTFTLSAAAQIGETTVWTSIPHVLDSWKSTGSLLQWCLRTCVTQFGIALRRSCIAASTDTCSNGAILGPPYCLFRQNLCR